MDKEQEGRTPRRDGPGEEGAPGEEGDLSARRRPQLPFQLTNWQVVEIEGEIVGEIGAVAEHSPAEDRVQPDPALGAPGPRPMADRVDDVVVLMLHKRDLALAPGETENLAAAVMNNGDRPSVFELEAQGNVSPDWFPDMPLRFSLQPGERKTFTFQVSPPRTPAARAGNHACALVAHASGYPGRLSRAAFTVTLAPYAAFRLGALQPQHLTATWWERSATATLPLTNLSNFGAEFVLAGADSRRLCGFEFVTPEHPHPQTGRASVFLEPGESTLIDVTVMPRRLPFIGLFVQPAIYGIAARMAGEERSDRQAAQGVISPAALIGPWQLASVAGLAVIGLIGLGLAGLVLLMALRVGQPTKAAVREESPVVALLLSMEQPLPQANLASPASATPGRLPPPVTSQTGPASVPLAGFQEMPVVQPDQVTAPGEPAAVAPAQPVVVAPPSTGGMTYAQMFQEVADRYDLDWRRLAAQGYVESGFDALALGSQGSLGLMQIQPGTWQEWAPVVDAADPFDSYSSALVAAVYLDYLRAELGKRGYPQVEWMLAAYNWGPDKVFDLLERGGVWEDLPAEVRGYAADVLRIAQSIPAR